MKDIQRINRVARCLSDQRLVHGLLTVTPIPLDPSTVTERHSVVIVVVTCIATVTSIPSNGPTVTARYSVVTVVVTCLATVNGVLDIVLSVRDVMVPPSRQFRPRNKVRGVSGGGGEGNAGKLTVECASKGTLR